MQSHTAVCELEKVITNFQKTINNASPGEAKSIYSQVRLYLLPFYLLLICWLKAAGWRYGHLQQ